MKAIEIVGLVIVGMCISGITHLTLCVIHDNYVIPPIGWTKWTYKVFLIALFILAIPNMCVTWVVGKFLNSLDQRRSKVDGQQIG